VRAANYIRSVRRDLLKVSEAVGVVHPGLITPWDVDILTGQRSTEALHDVYGYEDDWGAIGPDLRTTIEKIMTAQGEPPEPRPPTR
jgi:glutamate synthase (ferredoxin)